MKKKLLAVLLTIILAAGLTPPALGEEISPDALREMIAGGKIYLLFDVRSAEAYEQGFLPGAYSMPLSTLEAAMKGAMESGFSQMNTPLYLYGETPEQGKEAAEILTGLGLKNVQYLASFGDWDGAVVTPGQLLGSLITKDIYGNSVDETLIQGKTLVMVNVWATYCTYCVQEMTDLGEISREMAEDGVQVVGLLTDCSDGDLSANESQTALARQIAEGTQADYPHLLPNLEIYRNVFPYIDAVPTTFFLNGQGEIVGSVYKGSRSGGQWRQIIAETLESMK